MKYRCTEEQRPPKTNQLCDYVVLRPLSYHRNAKGTKNSLLAAMPATLRHIQFRGFDLLNSSFSPQRGSLRAGLLLCAIETHRNRKQ